MFLIKTLSKHMNKLLELRREHHRIEDILILLEEMIDEGSFDIKFFTGVFNNLFDILEKHEKKEELLFNEINKFNLNMRNALDEINKVHRLIEGHIAVLKDALEANDLNYINLSIKNDGRMFFSKLRDHMYYEEKIFDSILFINPKSLAEII